MLERGSGFADLLLGEGCSGEVDAHRTRSLRECVNAPDRHGMQPLVSCLLFAAGHQRCLMAGSGCEAREASGCSAAPAAEQREVPAGSRQGGDEQGYKYVSRLLAHGADAGAALVALPAVTKDVSVLDSLLWHASSPTPQLPSAVIREEEFRESGEGRGSTLPCCATGEIFNLFDRSVWCAMVQVRGLWGLI